VVMARVPKGNVRDRNAHEFYSGMDGRGEPTWSADISKRKPIFSDPRGVQRISLTYTLH